MAQKPKRVGRLANVGAKVRNINETVKLFGNFLLFNNFFALFEGCLSTVHLIKWEVSHGTISPAKAAYLRESSGTGSLHLIANIIIAVIGKLIKKSVIVNVIILFMLHFFILFWSLPSQKWRRPPP